MSLDDVHKNDMLDYVLLVATDNDMIKSGEDVNKFEINSQRTIN